MINTVNTKLQQLTNGYFKIGNGKETILVIGSCRSVPYLNYLDSYNKLVEDRFTILFIDPYNWNYDLQDNRTNMEEVITSLETYEKLLEMFKSVDIYIHEYYNHFGMFCCDKGAEKNIYQYGLKPEIDICLPNFNDLFILSADIVAFDAEVRKLVMADYNVLDKLSHITKLKINSVSAANVEKFVSVALKSDIPEMASFFKSNFLSQRFFHSYNHVSKNFTLQIFAFLSYRLGLKYTNLFWSEISKTDMYANNITPVCDLDVEMWDFKWNEPIVPLRSKL